MLGYKELIRKYKINNLVETEHIIEKQRMIKDQEEISSLEKACEITDNCFQYILTYIKPGMTERQIADEIEEYYKKRTEGLSFETIVASGENTSKPHAVPTDRKIQENDIITIDLSPQVGNIWGDYARTIIVENGEVVDDIELIQNQEWKSGLQMEDKLHAELFRFVTKGTTFEELYYHMNEFIVENGFVNLDFMGNLGHSIAKVKSDRIYIEKGNKAKLVAMNYFTFEPHIAFPDSKYGYKKENIYYFDEDVLVEL